MAAASFGDVPLSGFVSIYWSWSQRARRQIVLGLGPQSCSSPLVVANLCADQGLRQPNQLHIRRVVGRDARMRRRSAHSAASSSPSRSNTPTRLCRRIATTGSIVPTTVLNAAFLSGPFHPANSGAGGSAAVVSVFNYNDNGDPR